jgi:hypothetical protein
MGIPKNEVLPSGIKRRRQPVVARSHLKNLDRISIRTQENSNITHGISAGTSRFLVKTSAGILRRTSAGNDIYMTNMFNTFPVSSEKSGIRFNAIPMSRNVTVNAKFSIVQNYFYPL